MAGIANLMDSKSMQEQYNRRQSLLDTALSNTVSNNGNPFTAPIQTNFVNSVLDTLYNIANKNLAPSSTLLKTTVTTGTGKDTKERAVYKLSNGKYVYIDDAQREQEITDPIVLKQLQENKPVTINLDYTPRTPEEWYIPPATQTITRSDNIKSTSSTKEIKQPVETTPSNNVGGGGGGVVYIQPDMSAYNARIDELMQKIYDLEHPKVYSAQELADIYGIDYNEQRILDEYNQKTNDYYNAAINKQNDLRTQYARNNASYVDRIIDSYLNSYNNAAPTAMGRGTLAANALSTQINATNTNSQNDYGMMQSVNNLAEARKAELENNPNLARQYYNSIGTYLSSLSADLNKSDVQQYIDQLDAYSQMYAADRSYQAYLAQANNAKYAGLADAAITNANAATSGAGSTANNYQKLWDYYYTSHNNNADYANNAVANLLRTSTGTKREV